MTDPMDFAAPELNARTTIRAASVPAARDADMIAYRLAELQCSPIRGGFDAAHLQNIHHYLFQHIDRRAGELRKENFGAIRASQLESSIDRILDGLQSENHLRGLGTDAWAQRAAEYTQELSALHPFSMGSEIAIREFVAELAAKNGLTLEWARLSGIGEPDTVQLQQETQSGQLRRLILLAMDDNPNRLRPTRHVLDRGAHGALSLSLLPL